MNAKADTAFRVADRLRKLAPPWDVYAERCRKFEIHVSAGRVELVRGPVSIEGYGIRVLRPRDGGLSGGLQSSTDLSAEGVASVTADAEANARYAKFPARSVELPDKAPTDRSPDIADRTLWSDPASVLARHVAALQAAFESEPGASITFGSVKATLVETTLANSSGLAASYEHALVESEIGVLASGGPEGAPAGEYWVTESGRRLETSSIPARVHDWARFARDARRGRAPPTGQLPVILPPGVLEGVLPAALDLQFSGVGRLHEIAPAEGTVVGPASLEVTDDGNVPWAVGSAPFDDEGVPQRPRHLVREGKTQDLLCDLAYASAIGRTTTGSGWRVTMFGGTPWYRFTHSPQPGTSTITIPGGDGGTDEELIEAAHDGIWVQQIGWASPNSTTTAFGGEIRIGYRIRDGKLAEPIRGGTVGGLVIGPPEQPTLFRDLIAVGANPRLSGGVRVPTLLSRGLTVSGDSTPKASP
jgi:predicted Zn-dependent protease